MRTAPTVQRCFAELTVLMYCPYREFKAEIKRAVNRKLDVLILAYVIICSTAGMR